MAAAAVFCVAEEEAVEETGHPTEVEVGHRTMTATIAIPEVDPKRRGGYESGMTVIEAIDTHQRQT